MDVQSGSHLAEVPWRRSLATRLSRVFILVVVLSLVVVGVVMILIARKAQRESVFRLQERSADKVALLISSYVGHAVEDLMLFEGIESLSAMTPAEQKIALDNLLIQRRTLFSQFALIDKDGTEVTKVSQFYTFLPSELKSQADTDAFATAIGGMPYIGSVFVSPDSGLLSVRIAVPINAPGERNVGALVAEVNVARLWQEISRIKIGQTSYAYLVDNSGRFIAHQEPAKVLQQYGEDMTKMPPVAEFVDREPEDVKHVHEYVGLTGESVIGLYVPIQGIDWAVVVEMSTREAYASVNQMQWFLMGLTLLGIVVAGVLGFAVSQRFSRPIRALTMSAQCIGAGDQDTELVEVRRQDEIGVLARTFNQMVENIKQSAEALRVSEEKYRGIFENAVEGIFQSTLDGHFLSVNPALARILGYGSPEEMISNVTDIGQQLYADTERREGFIRLIEQGSVKDFEAELYRKDGSMRWVSLNARALYDERGKQNYLEGIVLDITKRKKADEALRKSEERYRDIFKNAAVSIWEEDFTAVKAAIDDLKSQGVTDFQKYLDEHPEFVLQASKMVKVVDINKATIKMFGAANKEEMLGSLDKVFVPESLPTFREQIVAIAEGQTYFESEGINQTLQGERLNILMTITIPSEAKKFSSVLISIMDITALKRAEDEIRTQSKFLQTAIDALTHPFYTINIKDYSISLFNKAAGIDISEKTSTCYALTHGRSEPCRKDDHPCPIEEIKVTGRPTTVEHIHLDKNGNERIIEIDAFPIFDSKGNLSQIIEYTIDITERKTDEEELRKHREHLEDLVKERTNELEATQEELVKHEKLSVLGQLTAMVSHELRNPLGVIRSSTFYLESKLSDADDKIRKHLQRIEQQVGLCDTIVDDLLEYTRGRRSEMDKGEMTPWIEEVLDQMTIPDQVSLVRKLSPDIPIVRFDREKLRRVVINLVDNALQAVLARQERMKDEDGPYQPQVKLSASVVENSVRIEVEDNGIGMNDETAGRALEPLFTTKARGTGLGLAIVQKIVEEHGGSVSLNSEPDSGTKSFVMIPLLTRQQEQADGK